MLAYGMITKGNGDVILSPEKHTSLSTGGGQAGQGYPCVLEPIGADLFNQTTTGTVTMTMSNRATDAHHIPCVIEPICFTHDTWMKINNEGVAYTVLERDNKNPQCVVTEDAESNRNA